MISTAIIGAGTMGSAFYKGLSSQGKAGKIWLCDQNEDKLQVAPANRRIDNPASAGKTVECILLAVKPQSFAELMATVGNAWSGTLVISIMAGITMKTIADATGASAIVRAMPNLGARVGHSITGWYPSSAVTPAQLKHTEELFSAIGMSVRLKEEAQIDGFTAVAGSGPAYVFLLAELLENAARDLGIDEATGAQIARELLGAGSLLLNEKERSAAQWREAVTSKGGTTEAALRVMKEKGLSQIFSDAIAAATDRSRSLSHDDKSHQPSPRGGGATAGEIGCSSAFGSALFVSPWVPTEQLQATKQASRMLAGLPEQEVNAFLLRLADALEQDAEKILQANQRDLARMNPEDPKFDRLLLNQERIQAIAKDVRTVAGLPSPVGKILEEHTRPNGLKITKISVPIGVIGIVYEARPNVTVDSFSLCFKSRNASTLKGGSDASFSNEALAACIHRVLRDASLPEEILLLLPPDRSAVTEMLHARGLVDVVIPRGSQKLIDFVREEATIPVIETGAGIVHIYVDQSADVAMAASVIFNAKTRRPGVCNTVDTVIIHADRLSDLLQIMQPLQASRVRIFADKPAFDHLSGSYDSSLLEPAKEEHFGTEFLSLKLSVATVRNMDEALAHIRCHSSGHSESIIAKDQEAIERFLREVDAAAVYANASTAFTDGGEFGLGAEIGISTQKLHARGPMGLEALTSYKWIVRGNGQIRA